MSDLYAKRGIIVRIIYLLIAFAYYVLWGFTRKQVQLVLCYHGIRAEQKDRFEWQIKRLKTKLIKRSNATTGTCICITFDDAFDNLLNNALPVLEYYHIPATIFAVAGNLGETPHWKMPPGHPESNEKTMTADQLISLSKNPLIKIGSHTLTHPDLTAISYDQVRIELADSKQKLEMLLGYSVEDLALPHGAYNQAVLTMALDAGYKRIYTLDPQPVDLMSNNSVIGRFSMSPEAWKVEFILTCAGAYSWLYKMRCVIHFITYGPACKANR